MLIMEIYKRGTPHNLCTWKNPPFNSKVGYMIISKKENMSNPVLFLLVVCTIGIMGHPEEEGKSNITSYQTLLIEPGRVFAFLVLSECLMTSIMVRGVVRQLGNS